CLHLRETRDPYSLHRRWTSCRPGAPTAPTAMAPTPLILFFAVLSVKSVLGKIYVNVRDSVTLTENCTEDKDFILKTRDNTVMVAQRVNGVWTPGEVYKTRIKPVSSSSVNLTRVNYNDIGFYEFTCGRRVLSNPVYLKVVTPVNLSATEGQTVELPCRSVTAGLDPSSGGIRNGTGYEGRVSVPADWKLTGDFSLTLDRVQLEDEGQFICFIDKAGTRTRGDPAAVMMKVNKKTPNQTTTIVVLSVLVFIFFCLWLRLYLKSRTSSKVPPGPGDVEMGLLSGGGGGLSRFSG
uniref:Ig-like domain-containing protein n=1 Tax=Dicentrarchus labrax TaxID=13489 RepID=A0A8P4G9X3_DICLA